MHYQRLFPGADVDLDVVVSATAGAYQIKCMDNIQTNPDRIARVRIALSVREGKGLLLVGIFGHDSSLSQLVQKSNRLCQYFKNVVDLEQSHLLLDSVEHCLIQAEICTYLVQRLLE